MLEDSSFAIHPGKDTQNESAIYQDIGNLLKYTSIDNGYKFICENGQVITQFYTNSIVRIVMNQYDTPKLSGSKAVIVHPELVEVKKQLYNDLITLETDKIQLQIKKSPFRLTVVDKDGHILIEEGKRGMAYQHNGKVAAFKKMNENDHFYGFGEKTGHLNKQGEKYEMWNTDVYAPHNPETDPLYESIPYFMTLRNGLAHGIFFDNTFRTVFDMKSDSDYYSFEADGGQLDYYVLGGSTPKAVLNQYTYLTGKIPLPPKWALGYHQSRYSYETEAEVRELADNFIKRNIPIDVIHLDIHYKNGYRVFTFDKERFPNPKQLIADLNDMGIRIVPIVNPGVKKDPEYKLYQEGIKGEHFCKYAEGDIYLGEVWPGISAFPDFTNEKTREWWAKNHSFYTNLGIEGIWNDMNEPAVFNETKTMDIEVMHQNDGNPTTHRELHNVYGFLMEKATYDGMKKLLNGRRPFLLTRAGYSGIQRYAAVWTGDNRSFWEHLQMSLPMIMNLGLSGIPFAGPDVGGFAHDTNAELLTRWTQVGTFTPFFRNHSAIGFRHQEPWQFGERYEAIMKKYIQMRYEWLPQLYSLFYQASKQGIPVFRPLLMEYPNDVKTYNLNDQFMIGDNVIVAPILTPSTTDRAVYLPIGEWVEFSSGKIYQGEKVHLIHAELEEMPIFIKRGSAIMLTEWISNLNKTPKTMTMNIYASEDNEKYQFNFYDDDGESFNYEHGEFLYLNMEIESTKEYISIDVLKKAGHFSPEYDEIKINVIGRTKDQHVIINGNQMNDGIISLNN